MFVDYLFIMIEYCNVDINSLECKVLLLVKAAQRSPGIIASNSALPSSGSLRIIGQLDLFNRRIIGQKIMAASKYQTARKWDTGHYGSKEVPGVLGQKGDFPKN